MGFDHRRWAAPHWSSMIQEPKKEHNARNWKVAPLASIPGRYMRNKMQRGAARGSRPQRNVQKAVNIFTRALEWMSILDHRNNLNPRRLVRLSKQQSIRGQMYWERVCAAAFSRAASTQVGIVTPFRWSMKPLEPIRHWNDLLPNRDRQSAKLMLRERLMLMRIKMIDQGRDLGGQVQPMFTFVWRILDTDVVVDEPLSWVSEVPTGRAAWSFRLLVFLTTVQHAPRVYHSAFLGFNTKAYLHKNGAFLAHSHLLAILSSYPHHEAH